MALPASDDFNRSDGAVGANYTTRLFVGATAGMVVNSNECKASGVGSSWSMATWTADTFPDDQFAQFKMVNQSAYCGVVLRWSDGGGGAANCYLWFNTDGDNWVMYRMDAGSFTLVYNGPTLFATNSIFKAEAIGSDFKVYDDGVQDCTTQVDATYASGEAGIWGLDDGSPSVGRLDDFLAGAIAGGISIPVFVHHFRQQGIM